MRVFKIFSFPQFFLQYFETRIGPNKTALDKIALGDE
jgi:hypothetical protein